MLIHPSYTFFVREGADISLAINRKDPLRQTVTIGRLLFIRKLSWLRKGPKGKGVEAGDVDLGDGG